MNFSLSLVGGGDLGNVVELRNMVTFHTRIGLGDFVEWGELLKETFCGRRKGRLQNLVAEIV